MDFGNIIHVGLVIIGLHLLHLSVQFISLENLKKHFRIKSQIPQLFFLSHFLQGGFFHLYNLTKKNVSL